MRTNNWLCFKERVASGPKPKLGKCAQGLMPRLELSVRSMKMNMKALLLCSIAISAATAAIAQAPVSPLPPSEASKEPGRSPAVAYLMQYYGITEADAQERLAVQAEVMELSARLNRENDPSYADIWTEHSPVFKVVVAFADTKDRKELLDSLSPKLRRYVQLRTVPKSRSQIQADLETLASALKSGGFPFGGGFDPITGRYNFEVETQQAANAARALIPPSLRDQVGIVVKRLPKPEAAPTGVQSGDWIAGGYPLYPIKTDAQCTFGFPVRFGSNQTKGILTAGHCGEIAEAYYNGHWITFAKPVIRYSQVLKYDYEIFESTGLTDGGTYEVYYENRHSIPGISTRSYFQIYAWVGWASQNVGDTVCKSGQQTGLTCGQIVNDNVWYNNSYGSILVSRSSQPDISDKGDSGGPWFFHPGTGTRAIAAGIHVAGEGVGSSATAVYMPVEWIDDHDPTVKLLLTP
jgi:hypothetical protein